MKIQVTHMGHTHTIQSNNNDDLDDTSTFISLLNRLSKQVFPDYMLSRRMYIREVHEAQVDLVSNTGTAARPTRNSIGVAGYYNPSQTIPMPEDWNTPSRVPTARPQREVQTSNEEQF